MSPLFCHIFEVGPLKVDLCPNVFYIVSGKPRCLRSRPERRIFVGGQEGLRGRFGGRVLPVIRQRLDQVCRSVAERGRQEKRESEEGAEEAPRSGGKGNKPGSKISGSRFSNTWGRIRFPVGSGRLRTLDHR
jgi:hypothetical protein